jgi:hypothetical protein
MARLERQTARIQPFVAACRYRVGEERASGFVTDISVRGCRVHTQAPPPAVGAAVTLEVRFGRQATHVRIPGTVRWTRSSPRGGHVFGVRFDGIGPAEQHVLDGVIEEFRRRAAAIESSSK